MKKLNILGMKESQHSFSNREKKLMNIEIRDIDYFLMNKIIYFLYNCEIETKISLNTALELLIVCNK